MAAAIGGPGHFSAAPKKGLPAAPSGSSGTARKRTS